MAISLPLSDIRYQNWLAAGYGLKVLKEALEDFVTSQISLFHADVLQNVKGSSAAIDISKQTYPLKRPQEIFCTVHKSNSRINHCTDDCPNEYCHRFAKYIAKHHRRLKPIWTNTNPSLWISDPWEIAKCFCSGGYTDTHSAEDTDCTGLLSIVINLKPIGDSINLCDKDVKVGKDVFSEAQDIRNEILHSATYELDDFTKNKFIIKMENVVKIIPRSHASHGVGAKLENLRKGSMVVSQPAADEIKAAALNAIKDITQTTMETIENKAKNVMASSLVNLDSQRQQGMSSIKEKCKICEQKVDTKTKQVVAMIDDKARRCEQEVETKKQDAVAAIETKTNIAMTLFQEFRAAADDRRVTGCRDCFTGRIVQSRSDSVLHCGADRNEVRSCLRSQSCLERIDNCENRHSGSHSRHRNEFQPITQSLTKFSRGEQCKYYDRFPTPTYFDHACSYQNIRPLCNEYCGYAYNNNNECQKCGKGIREDYHCNVQYSPTRQPASVPHAPKNINLPYGNFKKTPVLPSFPKQEQHMNQTLETWPWNIFVTHSVPSGRHVVNLVKCLQKNGFRNCCMDNVNERIVWCNNRFEEADFVLMCITPSYLVDITAHSCSNDQTENALHTAHIYQLILNNVQLHKRGLKIFIPLLFGDVQPEDIPTLLETFGNYYVWPNQYKDAMWRLTKPETRIN